jgi:DNA-binding Xre family transcriptional regulator
MAELSIAASDAGIEKAKTALLDKGWSRQDLADRVVIGENKNLRIGISIQTLHRFFTQKAIKSQIFVGICKALGLDWQEIKNLNTTTSPQISLSNGNQIVEVEQPNINYNNPFIPLHGKIDDPRFFFGREQEMRLVFETLNSGSNVAIIGERGIGKSSLLQAIYRQSPTLLRHPRQPIYLNLLNIYDEHDFYDALCGEAGIKTVKGYQLQRALQSHRVLLLLDEVEKMTWDGFTNQIRGQLRGLADGTDPSLRLVIAASTYLDNLFTDSQDKNMTSPFKGIFMEETLKQWDDEISRKFIASRLQADWLTPGAQPVSFTEEEIAGLIAESGGYPQKLMQLCYQTYACYINDPKSGLNTPLIS